MNLVTDLRLFELLTILNNNDHNLGEGNEVKNRGSSMLHLQIKQLSFLLLRKESLD